MRIWLEKSEAFADRCIGGFTRFCEKYFYYIFAFFCLVISLLCFINLGKWQVLDWDEARHGISAYEMIKNGNFAVNTFRFNADYWNLKPPLSFLAIAFCFKLFGYSVFGLRFYSALSFVLFSVFTGFFVYKRYGKLHSLFTLGIIIACSPFYIYHCARNGDADALFLLFFSLAVMLSTTKKFFWCGGLCLALCFLTKSWHAGCALLIIILYQLYLYFKRDRLCLKQILYFFAALLFPVLLWAIIRYANDGTKFFTQMVKYDLLARTDRGVENHVFGVGFYFKYLAEQMPLIFLGLIAVLICAAIRYKKDVLMFLKQPKFLFLLMWICVPFIIFTLAKTKLYWYILPCAAGIVVLTGILLGTLVKNPRFSSIAKTVLLLFFAVFICRTGARNINRFLHPSQSPLQTFISQNCDSVKGYNAYIECYDENGAVSGRWSQSAVFVAEISGDLYCIDGGAKEFLGADTDSRLIIILNNRVGKYDFSDYYICASDDNYCMLIPKGGEMNE